MPCDPAAFAAAWAHELAQSPWFATNALTWTHGPLSLTVEPDAPDAPPWHLLLHVHAGQVLALAPTDAETARSARFRLKAPAATWARVLAGDLDPMKAILGGELHLGGRLGTVAPYVRAAQELANAARAAAKRLDTGPRPG